MKSIVAFSLLVVAVSALPTTKSIDGGKVDADVNSAVVKVMAQFAYVVIFDEMNTAHAMRMSKVTKAQSQVVSGVKYYLTIELDETDCARTVKDMDGCKTVSTKVCEAVVLSKPWDPIHKKELLSYTCSNK